MSLGFPCSILPRAIADGPENMATDEALLDFAAEAPDRAFFRVYQWSEPTLSLGYFQSIDQAEADGRWNGAAIVRRPTGGGALWHDRELTYALVLPKRHPLSARTARLYEVVHATILQALSDQAIHGNLRGEVGPIDGPKPFLCFLDRDSNDVVLGGRKIVGSAQRRRAGAVLQHGSILVRGSERTPELPGIADLTGSLDGPEVWIDRVESVVPRLLGLENEPSDWPGQVLERAEALSTSVYRNDGWTRRR